MVYHFVKYLEYTKNHKAHWIRNTYVRPSNRRCMITVNKRKTKEKALKELVIYKVCEALKSGKKIVVSSSTKRFTEEIKSEVFKQFTDTKAMLVYNSDTDRKTVLEHAMIPNDVWKQYDILIYSPSITAGISFEMQHFDEMFSYLENSFFTPTVDLALQQMFRVRQLVGGNMNIFINDCIQVVSTDYPVCEADIESFLDKNIQSLNAYFPEETVAFESNTLITPKGLSYDKKRMSYGILKGIVASKNKSIKYFSEVLVNTLREDYNIPCEVKDFDSCSGILEKSIKLELSTYNKDDALEVTKDNLSTFIITQSEYEELCRMEICMENLSDKEKMCKHMYRIGVDLWGIEPSLIDFDFYKDYIGVWNDKKKVKETFDTFYKSLRFTDLLNYSLDENRERMHSSLATITDNATDRNLEIYKTKMRSYYVKLLESTELLNCLLGEEGFTKALKDWREHKQVNMATNTIKDNFKKYVEGLTEQRFMCISKEFGLDRRYYKNVGGLNDQATPYIKVVLKEAFGIHLKTSTRGSHNPECKSYNVKKNLTMDWFFNMVTKYNPSNVKVFVGVIPNEYMIMDDPLDARP